PAFEPGFGTGSYYFDQIPLPMNILPYCLSGFVYREVTWDPGLTFAELKQRIHQRYFSPETPKRFVNDMISLQQFSFDHWLEITRYAKPRFGYSGETIERLTIEGERKRVAAIADVKQREAEADQLRKTFQK